jgi:hypothetical protein
VLDHQISLALHAEAQDDVGLRSKKVVRFQCIILIRVFGELLAPDSL